MKLTSATSIFFLFLLLVNSPFAASESDADIVYPMTKITIKAVDDAGVALENANVTVNIDFPMGAGMGGGSTTKCVDGTTDKKGEFTLTKATAGKCSFRVSKTGFYDSSIGYQFKDKNIPLVWSPWNPTVEIKLKKIKNPARMYSKSTTPIKVPAYETPVGYDFEKGDWVMPYGKGISGDIIFNFKIERSSEDDWVASYELMFSNENDGIQEYLPSSDDKSVYKWPYEAPDDGYKSEITWSAKNYRQGWGTKHKSDYKEDRQYIFRVRTKTDQNGNVIEAKYGKISGDIELYGNGLVKFSYCFNPSGSRSLEYDSKNPLLLSGQGAKGNMK